MKTASNPQPRASMVLVLLLLAYILNFLDRQMLGILAQPIKADLNLSDTQFGAIGAPHSRSFIPPLESRSLISPTRPAEAP